VIRKVQEIFFFKKKKKKKELGKTDASNILIEKIQSWKTLEMIID